MLNVSKTGSLQRIPIFASALLMRTRLYKTMETNTKREPLAATCIKITVYAGHIPYEVVYYRNRIPAYMAVRWMWYFEYLAALVKVNNPHRHVDLYVGPQTLRQGRDYVEHKIETLLRAKRARLKRECKPVDDDLFGYRSEEQRKRIDALYHEIDKLEHGEFNGYVPPVYINNIKLWTRRNTQGDGE